MTTTIEDLTTATPQQIDEVLYGIYREIGQAQSQRDYKWDRVIRSIEKYLKKGYRDRLSTQEVTDVLAEVHECADEIEAMSSSEDLETRLLGYRTEEVFKASQEHQAAEERVTDLILSQQPYDEEWERRGRWTRAFIVTNANGHVHRSMHCSTCFPTTWYHWLTEMSDHDETEIVEKAGERACTVCYPSAPVEVTSRPSQFTTPDEDAKAKARQEREEKAAAKRAAEVTVEDYTDYSGRPRTKVFKTVRAVTNAIASDLSDLCFYGVSHPSAVGWATNVKVCRDALEAKGVDYDYDKALAAARKKVTREGGTPQF